MLASAIRELVASKQPTLIAAAFFEKKIQIWDLKSQEKISEFPAVFCSGADNLAFAPLGGILVTGLSTNHGKVAAYEVQGGKKLWEQRLVYPSSLRFHPSGQSILCTRNGQSVLRLDVQTGKVLEVIDGTRQCIEEPSGDRLLFPDDKGRNSIRLTRGSQTFNVDRPRFGLLDAQFSPHSICLAEAGSVLPQPDGSLSHTQGRVRCISRVDGRSQWTFDTGTGCNVQRLHYSLTLDAFFGVFRNFEKRGSRTLIRFEPTSGVSEPVCEFDSWYEVFLDSVDQLVTSAGEIRSLSTGALLGRLAFPLREYPDD